MSNFFSHRRRKAVELLAHGDRLPARYCSPAHVIAGDIPYAAYDMRMSGDVLGHWILSGTALLGVQEYYLSSIVGALHF